ncbi:MAG: PAS domain-containing protein [Candidatus Syntrophopropionicum ammoniitolerans]
MVTIIIVVGGGFIAILLFLLWDLRKKTKSLGTANKELANYNALRKTFMDADTDFIYLKDEQLRYVFVNKALEDFFQLPGDKVIGFDDASLLDKKFAEVCTKADWDALKNHQLITSTTSTGDRFFRTTKFPVPLPNGAPTA